MKVVGLLSGGKDSVYNLIHCIANGHEPVAVASLGPPSHQDEMDSYMYQTVGHSGLRTLATALDLSFFSREITGTALHQGGDYGDREGQNTGGPASGGKKGDETEDLYELLSAVKQAMPEVQAVAAGAILSNYQRVRVEHVCSRLGLTPIAYLWERNQEELLAEMVKAGMHSVLVKVAGAGLELDHLGKSLAEMQPTLKRLNTRFQTHMCGEGGEYETFTLDCPIFKQRVVLTKTTTVVSDPSPWSTVAHLHLDSLALEPKADFPLNETFEELRSRIVALGLVGVPELFDSEGLEALDVAGEALHMANHEELSAKLEDVRLEDQAASTEVGMSRTTSRMTGDWLHVGEITARTNASASLEDEVRACFAELEDVLATHKATLLHLAHLTLYLSPPIMSQFPLINSIYRHYFGTSPPTRACVSVLLPTGTRLKLEGVANLGPLSARQALHVQSISYWAPANIGPYSQVVTAAHERAFIAGQIPLVPASLSLQEPADFARDVALSLQHVRRVKRAATEGGRWRGWSEGGVCWIAPAPKAMWRRRAHYAVAAWQALVVGDDEDEEWSREAPMVCIQAENLPRGAAVEWQVTWATGTDTCAPDDDEDGHEVDCDPRANSRRPRETWLRDDGSSSLPGARVTRQCSRSNGVSRTINLIVTCSAGERRPQQLTNIGEIQAIKAFHLPHVSLNQIQQTASALFSLPADDLPALSTVGTRLIALGDESDEQTLPDLAFVVTACNSDVS